jgi:cephalosporin hydroxylase
MAKWFNTMRKVLLDPLAWQLSKRELHRLTPRQDVLDIVRATKEYVGRGYYASISTVQVESEIVELAKIVQSRQPRVIVEIGTYKGGTFYIWCRVSSQAKMCVSIDLPGGDYGGGYSKRRLKLYHEFLHDRNDVKLQFIRNNSHNPDTLKQLQTALAGRLINFLYIDGDHTYAGVKRDYEMYRLLVAPGGIIAFHDIVTKTKNCGVYQFWHEIKADFTHQEVIAEKSNKGIGIIYV